MTFHFTCFTPYGQTEITALAQAFNEWAVVEFVPILTTTDAYNGVEVRGLESLVDLFSQVVVTGSPGTLSSAPMSNQDCVAVKRVTGNTGRSARGRVYVPTAVAMLDANEDFITTGYETIITDALNEISPAAAAVSWFHVVLSRQNGGVVLESGVTRAITAYVMADRELDTQRRRMPSK